MSQEKDFSLIQTFLTLKPFYIEPKFTAFLQGDFTIIRQGEYINQCFSIRMNNPIALEARLERVSSGSANSPMNELIDDAFNGIHAGS